MKLHLNSYLNKLRENINDIKCEVIWSNSLMLNRRFLHFYFLGVPAEFAWNINNRHIFLTKSWVEKFIKCQYGYDKWLNAWNIGILLFCKSISITWFCWFIVVWLLCSVLLNVIDLRNDSVVGFKALVIINNLYRGTLAPMTQIENSNLGLHQTCVKLSKHF